MYSNKKCNRGVSTTSLKLLFLFVLVLSMCPFGYAGIQDAENKKRTQASLVGEGAGPF